MSITSASCTICGIPHPINYVVLDGKCMCDVCWHKMFPYCKSCGIRLTYDMNIAYFKDRNGKLVPYCTKCSKNPVCCCCGLPIQTGHKKNLDERFYCSECFSSIPQDNTSNLSDLWRPVCKFMMQKFNFRVRSPLPQWVTRAQLSELTGNPDVGQEAGLYKYTYTIKTNIFPLWGSRRTFSNCQIFLLKGLTTEHSEEVLAHEAGHDLLDSILPMFSEKLYSEGFAQYIASQYNTYRNRTSRNEDIFSNDDPVYGDGVRLVRDIVAKTGFHGLINMLRGR